MSGQHLPDGTGGAPTAPRSGRLSRRRLLGGAALGGAAVGGAALGGVAVAPSRDDVTDAGSATGGVVAFHGAHQAGIVTPAQDRLHFAAFDVTTTDRAELEQLLRDWTDAARRLTRGLPAGAGAVGGDPLLPPDDTGEALGLPAARLTITIGVGPSLFDDRFGLAERRPAALRSLPHFPGDVLDPARSDGDLAVQACADDPQVAVHAVRTLARIAFGRASVRWSQLGFGRTSSTSTTQQTPRNLFGFKDGTANLKAEETAAVDEHVWVGVDDDPAAAWLAGGSYLVARRIAMDIEVWDRQPLADQEAIVGRTKGEGGPLSGGPESAAPDFAAVTGTAPTIPVDAHVRVVHPDAHGGARMLRRGYNFVDGSTGLGALDAGLFFLAYVRDPDRQFVPVQAAMSRADALREYLTVTGSALFAVLPGTDEAGFLGETLFA
ncbi:iron uptake transporter deferrochelatase/peroxidase subunit [Nocardioides sp.]|uniref:iron uptake transporter deferrochelatase/peroxidase subunit n=1 Tax=Nocardioides sp. TaxID=35761 RepID=UPI003511371D